MLPCLEGEGCDLLINRSGWTCTQPGGRIKTTTVSFLASCNPLGRISDQLGVKKQQKVKDQIALE